MIDSIIPNEDQKEEIIAAYKLANPKCTRIGMIPETGLILNRRKNSGSKILGQVTVIAGFITAYNINGSDHSIVYRGWIQNPKSELDKLKDRVAELEKKL